MTAPLEDWRTALEIIASPRGRESFLPIRRLLDGLRWEATDTDWAHGEGSTVTGGAEALAMVMSGRPAYLDRITGDGVATVRDRLAA